MVVIPRHFLSNSGYLSMTTQDDIHIFLSKIKHLQFYKS